MKLQIEEPLHAGTNLRWIRNFLSPEQIEELLQTAQHTGYQKSTVVTNDGFKEHPDRTSESCWLLKSHTPLIRYIEDQVCQITGCTLDDIEPIQMVKYGKGQKYLAHFDYFDTKSGQKEIDDRSQRVVTILAYLVKPTEGGETYFPRLNITIEPSVGDAVMWENCHKKTEQGTYGDVNPLTEHGGMPVKQDIKIAMNVWCRSRNTI